MTLYDNTYTPLKPIPPLESIPLEDAESTPEYISYADRVKLETKQYDWYKENGFYLFGKILDTNVKSGDKVTIIATHYTDPRLKYGSVHRVELVEEAYGYYSNNQFNKALPKYRDHNSEVKHPRRSLVKLYGISNSIKSTSVVKEGTEQMAFNSNALALPNPNAKNRTALVQEVVEETKDGKIVLTPHGAIVPFDNLSAAQDYVRTQIRDTIRSANEYRQFKIYNEVAVAHASEPPVTFS